MIVQSLVYAEENFVVFNLIKEVIMGKVSPKENESKVPRQKRRTRSSNNKYSRPKALAQLQYSKASSTKSCTDLGKKRIVLSNSKKGDNNDLVTEQRAAPASAPVQETPVMMSLQRFGFPTVSSPINFMRQHSLPGTPKTPGSEDSKSESRLEALPMDALVSGVAVLHFIAICLFPYAVLSGQCCCN